MKTLWKKIKRWWCIRQARFQAANHYQNSLHHVYEAKKKDGTILGICCPTCQKIFWCDDGYLIQIEKGERNAEIG